MIDQTLSGVFTDQSLTTQVVEKFNAEIKKEFLDFYNALFEPNFKIPIFGELDSDKLRVQLTL